MWKEKLENWLEDRYFDFKHFRRNIYAFFHGIGRWISYFPVLRRVYDFDYSSILEVEKYQITRVRDCITKYQDHMNWERDVQHMNLALRLLDIIEEDGCAEIIKKPLTFDSAKGTEFIVNDSNEYWFIPVYVNTKNSRRFMKTFDPQKFKNSSTGDLWRDYLRVEKAWHLYHKVKSQYMREWWD